MLNMRKVKFTLGLVLSMLFLGASVSYAVNLGRLSVKSSSYYAGNVELKSYFENSDTLVSGTTTYSVNATWPNIQGSDVVTGALVARKYDGTGSYSGLTTISSLYTDNNAGYNNYLVGAGTLNGYTLYHEITVSLSFEKGKEVIPFLKRKITTGGGVAVQDLLLAYSITDKTEFTDGTDTATYKYKVAISPLVEKYNITGIDYELWVDDEISDNPGSGNAYPTIPRAVTIYTENGLSTLPVAGMTHYVNAYDDYTFEVYGEAGKELSVTTNNPHYAVGKGIAVVSGDDGVWTVKITRVYLALNIYVSYKTETEVADGNLILAKDAVWAAGGQLYIQSAVPSKLEVYSITGQLQNVNVVNGNTTLSGLPKGIYLVKLNGKTYKVIN
jgi:hypothetical protein